MASKILVTLLILVLLQGSVFLVMLLSGNIQQEIKDAAFESFNDKIDTRKKTLEDVLTANVYKPNLYDEILSDCNQLRSTVTSNADLKVNKEIAESLKRLLHNTSSSGAFIIFESDDNAHNAFVVRDTEPNNVSINDGDLMALFGSSELIKETGLTLDYHWKTNITLDTDVSSYEFYHKPMETAKSNPQLSSLDLAYWSQPYNMSQDDEEIISFSFPLLDDQHEAYGVIGIQYTLSYLKSILPYEELNDGNGAYVLSYQNEDENTYSPLLISGPMYKDMGDFALSTMDDEMYTLQGNDKEATDASVRRLNLYNQNSPYGNESWSLIGLVPDHILLSALHVILRSLLIAISIAIIIGIIATFMITLYFSKPFVILLRTLNTSDPNKPVSLPKVHINELDHLSSVVENMSNNIFESSSRLSKIIRLMDLPLGAIEIDYASNKVFCTEKIGKLLNFTQANATKEYLMIDVFQTEMKTFNDSIIAFEEDENNDDTNQLYLVELINKVEKPVWYRFSVLKHADSTLITVTDVTNETLEKQKLEYERDYDILTNLLNRRAFKEAFDEIIKTKKLQHSALLLFDLDNLKYINDTYGHDFGDLYIKEASNVFLNLDSDHAIASRMAGDEFLVFLYGMESQEQLTTLATEIHHAMTQQELLLLNEKDNIRVRASAGIAWYPQDGKDYEELLKHADFAMYSAKHSLKGSIQVFDYEEYKNNYLLFETLEDFNKIIDEHLYHFAFQPIVDAVTGEIFGYEALIRPQGHAIQNPIDLIRIARSQSKLQIIERISFHGAIEEFHSQKEAFKNARLFINSIPKITWSDSLIQEIEEACADDLDRLVIEIIESDQITTDNLDSKKDTVKRWNAAIALDDFGSGYNNDTAILSIHPNYLKIDQEIIQGIDRDERRQMILKNLVEYSKAQGIKTIGEGTETLAEVKFLIEAGIDYLQGYYIAKPDFEVCDIHEDIKKEIRAMAEHRIEKK